MSIHTNRVFSTIAADFVEWDTEPSPDPTGVQYPGAGVFGVDTSDYAVSRKKVTAPDNHSWKYVASDSYVTIPENQQMLVHGGFDVDGEVTLLGEIVLL